MNNVDESARMGFLSIAKFAAMPAVQQFQSERVLFAAGEETFDDTSLRYAQTIAGMSDATLLVLRVAEEVQSQQHLADTALKTSEALLHGDRPFTPHSLLPVQYLQQHGEFTPAVLRTCAEFPSDLVVIPPDSGHTGRSIANIASSARVPVLAPRHMGGNAGHRTVVVGVDLRSPALPVLRAAAAFAGRFAATLVAVHNLAPIAVRAKGDKSRERTISHAPSDVMRAVEQLFESVQKVDTTAEAVVTTDADAARAILAIANQRRADLVVVGVRRKTTGRMSIGGRMPERVANHAHQSVLTIPVR